MAKSTYKDQSRTFHPSVWRRLRASSLLAAAVLIIGVSGLPVNSLQVSGLYSQRVVMNNESNAERERAFSEALAAVVLKITGERRWLEHPTIVRALANATSYVEAISYSSETRIVEVPATVVVEADEQLLTDVGSIASADDQNISVVDAGEAATEAGPAPIEMVETSVEQRYINVDFAAGLIDELLAAADIPVWESNRPSVLIWMVLQTEDGERSLLSSDSNVEIMNIITEFAQRRGLPVIFPLLDFEDRQNLSADTLWSMEQQVITDASRRYDADSILSGRLLFTASGELVGRWQFIFQEQADTFDGFDDDLQAYVSNPLDRVTNQLASYFAIVPELSNQEFVRLRVDGIKNLTAYSALLNYVANLGLVESVAAAELDGERLELQLGLLGDAQQLYELIALDRDLLPIESSMVERTSLLHYRWTR